MTLSFDVLLENKVLGPPIQRRLEEGRQEARHEGLQEGLKKGEAAMLRRFLESRFGPLPAAYSLLLEQAPEAQLNDIADRSLTVATVEEAFRTP